MNWSRYNEFVQGEDKIHSLFNCRTRKWLYLAPELYLFLLENINNTSAIKRSHPSLYKVLVDNKFIVDSIESEISECITEIETRLNSPEILKLTVNPTLDCNLRCWYCYEQHLHGSCMSENVINAISKFIFRSLKQSKYEKLQLAFFGGEPLMKFDKVIIPLLKEVKNVCDNYNVELAVSFTTNGVLLNNRIRTAIMNITSNVAVQIPFDGDAENHNDIKKFSNGKGSYEIVIKNAKEAITEGFRVTIRCNVTKTNIISFKNLIKDFEAFLFFPNVRFSFHKIWQESDDDVFNIGVSELKREISSISFKSNINSYFGDSINPCYGDYADNYVINYNGDVFKCTARDFKTKNRIGILKDSGEISFNSAALVRVKKSFTSDCPTCRRLPFCPICSQVRFESKDGKCPVKITPEEISLNINQLYLDLINQRNEI